MADDKMNNPGFGNGFVTDMLKDLQKQYVIDKKRKEKMRNYRIICRYGRIERIRQGAVWSTDFLS